MPMRMFGEENARLVSVDRLSRPLSIFIQYFHQVSCIFVGGFREYHNVISIHYMGDNRPLILDLIPLMFFRFSSFSINLDSTSCPKMKRYGDNGSPCLSPLLGLKLSDLPPFTSTSNETDDTQAITQFVYFSLNPRWSRTFLMNLQLTLSYAFCRSSFIAISPGFVFRDLNPCNSSWTII
ncbi:hypothetical protein ACB098_11G146600 [Castanea mollissima]